MIQRWKLQKTLISHFTKSLLCLIFFFFCAAQTTNQLRGKHGGRRRSNKKADLSVRPHPAHKDVQRDARPAHTTTTNYTTLRWASNVLQCFCTSHLLSQLSCGSKMLISKHILYDVQIISPFSYYSVCVCVCVPDPASLPLQFNEPPPDLLPPELPPKGIRRRQPTTKVRRGEDDISFALSNSVTLSPSTS